MPKEFETYMTYIKNLQFSDDPDYEFLKDLFHKLYEAEGFSYEYADFDWSQRGNLPTDVNRYEFLIKYIITYRKCIKDKFNNLIASSLLDKF